MEEKDGRLPGKTENIPVSFWRSRYKPPAPGSLQRVYVTHMIGSLANVNRLITVTFAEVLQPLSHLNHVRGRHTGESHSSAHSLKYVSKG